MLIVRAPMRISFVGGGTDLPAYYRHAPGRVISTAINKYVYVAINRPQLIPEISVRYSTAETAEHPSQIKNDRVREALLHLGILKNVTVGTFTDIPVMSGLGSSSSFSVALLKGLHMFKGKKMSNKEVAEAACHLEMELIKDPVGKQDQYAAAFGGLNVIQFNPDESVEVTPLRLDFKKRMDFENHILVFFTGIVRLASSVLTEQSAKSTVNLDTLKEMAGLVDEFRDRLVKGDFERLGHMLHEGWMKKKKLASNMSNGSIDELYDAGMKNGAWGGKLLGAGGGGCILFMAPLEKKAAIRSAVMAAAGRLALKGVVEVPVRFVQSGVEVLVNNERGEEQTHFA